MEAQKRILSIAPSGEEVHKRKNDTPRVANSSIREFVVEAVSGRVRLGPFVRRSKESNQSQQADDPVDPYALSLNLIPVAWVHVYKQANDAGGNSPIPGR